MPGSMAASSSLHPGHGSNGRIAQRRTEVLVLSSVTHTPPQAWRKQLSLGTPRADQRVKPFPNIS